MYKRFGRILPLVLAIIICLVFAGKSGENESPVHASDKKAAGYRVQEIISTKEMEHIIRKAVLTEEAAAILETVDTEEEKGCDDPFWEAVRESYEYRKDEFDLGDILAVESLYLECTADMDFSRLKDFKNLRSLTLHFPSDLETYPELSCIGELKDLKDLGITGYPLGTKTEFLEKLTSLEQLNLFGCSLTNIEFIRKLPDLVNVFLGENEITDISPLEDLKKLTKLDISDNQVSNLSPLSDKVNMEYLRVSFNKIEDFKPIWGMEHLFSFAIGENPGNNVGERMITPITDYGDKYKYRMPEEWEEKRKKAEKIFFIVFPEYAEDGTEVIDFAWGDLNGDDREDLAVTCDNLQWSEREENPSSDRRVFVLLEDGYGAYQSFFSTDIMGRDAGGMLGDPYVGIYCVDGHLIIQNYGGSSSRWDVTEIYHYNEQQMEKLWELSLYSSTISRGYEWHVKDMKAGEEYTYTFDENEKGE